MVVSARDRLKVLSNVPPATAKSSALLVAAGSAELIADQLVGLNRWRLTQRKGGWVESLSLLLIGSNCKVSPADFTSSLFKDALLLKS